VALVGASIGGSAALIAARRVKPPVDAAVELSGQAKPTSLLRIPLNGRGAVQQLTVPTMFVVANYDQDASVDETRAMYQANKATDERLLLLPGQFEGFGGWMVLHNTSGGFSTTTTVGELVAARSPMPFSECLVAYGTMCLTGCSPRAATRGLDTHMPLEYGAGWVGRPCLRRRWSLWVGATATAEIPCQVAWDQPAVIEAAGTYAVQGGLIGDWTITSFEKIARARSVAWKAPRCLQVLRTSSVIDVHGRFVVHAARRLRVVGLGRRAGRGRLRNAHRPGRPGRLGPSRMPRTCW
jgi:hypothetical protein